MNQNLPIIQFILVLTTNTWIYTNMVIVGIKRNNDRKLLTGKISQACKTQFNAPLPMFLLFHCSSVQEKIGENCHQMFNIN